ncbi:MAG: hypothetical protein J4N74_10975 [Chloroflexi bacterium]|nr:hypothetical protein [Chloroflexota bacterium]MCI0773923.1 hypothetical protein [Chloroflexota bacterium]MCI0854688.1 hypothetical protein [Chloroflexota bacterium]
MATSIGSQSVRAVNERLRSLVERIWPIVLLVALLWVVRYWHSSEFGLYEDDLTHLPSAAVMSGEELLQFVFDPVRNLRLHGNGHPLHFTLIFTLANFGWRLGDLNGPYWIGFVIGAINVALVYILLRRVHGKSLGVLGGLAYVLYSADTTQAFLTHSLGLQPSITLFLIATHAYLSGKRWIAYVLVALTLFIYETPYTVFFAVPLLMPKPTRGWVRDLVRHAAILGTILLGVIVWRIFVGDDRIAGLSPLELVSVPLLHMLEGPFVSLGTYLFRPIQTLGGLNAEIVLVMLVSFVGAGLLLARLSIKMPVSLREKLGSAAKGARAGQGLRASSRSAWGRLPAELRSLLRLAAIGFIMLVLAYPLTFTVRAYAISGRDTRVHAGGVVGAALLVGSVLLIGLQLAEAYGWRKPIALILAGWISLMIGYGFVIQEDYRLAWEYQKNFWTDLVQLVPDVGAGSVILVDPEGLRDTRQIGANYWNLPRVLDQLYEFPEDWKPPPRVIRLASDWEAEILDDGGTLLLNASTTFAPPSTYGTFDPSDVVLVEFVQGKWVRISGPVVIGGRELQLRPATGSGEPAFTHGFLYSLLIGEPSAE